SDGRIVIDYIATSLGKSFLHPYLDSLGGDFSHGVNFANLLATIAPPKALLPVGIWPRAWSPFYLDIQYNQFQQFINRSQIIREKGGG
ncbi:hypothetical protein Q8G46_27955, partial [Klebsiella pneumoniae]|uniref:hypothetical protein n=1 Tax=Klebsiella pneumoniae TaxID=573 RepID=UPI00301398BC